MTTEIVSGDYRTVTTDIASGVCITDGYCAFLTDYATVNMAVTTGAVDRCAVLTDDMVYWRITPIFTDYDTD